MRVDFVVFWYLAVEVSLESRSQGVTFCERPLLPATAELWEIFQTCV